ncbi:uncharacterized protein LOC128735198 [Sabethes cyaneus]|uniref:uncharacterized protein LOC128735198 n=1 Tax=Sabethes cyaneus TaxID=53552 RepID=UPI00237DC8B8|nr:uncharacterized protein LOC128735198 [Sabethes cyaneus]
MNFSKIIKKNGLFYYHRNKLLAKWETENIAANRAVNTEDQLSTSKSMPIKRKFEASFAEDTPLSEESSPEYDDSDKEGFYQSNVDSFEDVYSSFENDQHNDVLDRMDLSECITYWALKTNQSHASINLIMEIIRRKTNGTKLPRSARTLLKTSRQATTEIVEIAGGQYWYKEQSLSISININIDGIPLFKSSKLQFWPILFNISEMPEIAPMTVAIFYGKTKPTNLDTFLKQLVEELIDVINHGIFINNHKITVKLRCFICDSPARAFLKGVANFNSKNGCLKCVGEGEYSHESRTVVFTSINSAKRTDQNFRQNAYGLHQKSSTPLLKIPSLDMIEDIIVGDRLHLIDLGVMKRLLLGWRDGSLGYKSKLSSQQSNEISQILAGIQLPTEIHRKLRGMDFLSFWKASEFSSFLHYASIVVLKEFLPDDIYRHFLLFFCSITMLCSQNYESNWHVARKMLEKFVTGYMELYGEQFMTSNVHNLLHVVDEVERFGPLSTIAAYPFENALQRIKCLLRSGWKGLEQVINRLSEINSEEYYITQKSKTRPKNYPSVRICGGERVIDVNEDCFLNNSERNAWFLTHKNQIVRFDHVTEAPQLKIIGKIVKEKNDYFTYPFTSSFLNIYCSNNSNLSGAYSKFSCSDIKCKLVAIERRSNHVFIPLVHTLIKQNNL